LTWTVYCPWQALAGNLAGDWTNKAVGSSPIAFYFFLFPRVCVDFLKLRDIINIL